MIASLVMAAALLTPQETELKDKLPEIISKSAAHYRALDAAATPQMRDEKGRNRFPRSFANGAIVMKGIGDWTCGHYSGALWYLYEATGDTFFRDRAIVWTEILEPNAVRDNTHDLGFMMYCSYGNARRLLKTDRYDEVLRTTANSLCKRFNPDLGLIRSWGKVDDPKSFRVIPDNLMNLELLMWASKNGCGARPAEISVAHAQTTAKHHYRADAGCYHVLDYDQVTRRVKSVDRGQGASIETAWARGQSWSVYGYTLMYRETRRPEFLEQAVRCADFALNNPNLPADGVPYWDYGAPGEERDTSAGSILASALLELAGYVPAEKGAAYRALAVRQLLALASPAYFAAAGENGDFLLKHGVGHKPGKSEIDVPLNYGDYYFLEALLRFRQSSAL